MAGAFTDHADSQRVNQASERRFLARFDFVEEILGGFFGEAFEIDQRVELESVEIGDVFDQSFGNELIDDFVAEAVD
ncbi:MAG TPA: hypothetical protein VKT80_17625, partial [Chloroflexota bacterium]|nr:hypothetical protein [Chloroflexota bacterium]